MLEVKNISISTTTIDGKEKVIINFNNISDVNEGDTFFISAFNNNIDFESIASSNIEPWINWIVAIYNLKSSNSVASRVDKTLEILCNNSTASNLLLDTGNI